MSSNSEVYSLWVKNVKDNPEEFAGVYLLTNARTNTVYVGSTTRTFRQRWLRHINDLKKNVHSCHYLQNSFNKYGINCFEFSIIEKFSTIDEINNLASSAAQIRKTENRVWNNYKSQGIKLFNDEPSNYGSVRHSKETINRIKETQFSNWLNDYNGVNSKRSEILDLLDDPLLTQEDVCRELSISRSALQRFFYRQDGLEWNKRGVQQKYKKLYEDFYSEHKDNLIDLINDQKCTKISLCENLSISTNCLNYLLKEKNLIWISNSNDVLTNNKHLVREYANNPLLKVTDLMNTLSVSKSSIYRFLKKNCIKWA